MMLKRQASLGITQHLIKSGIARLEEVRAADGTLENAYVRVDREKVLKAGCDDYHPKPVDFGKLLTQMEALLARGPRAAVSSA